MTDARYRRLNGYLYSFFNDYLQNQRGVSINTIRAYRDTWSLLFRFGIAHKKMPKPECWRIYQVDRQLILDFLVYLEDERGVCIRTRNLRLAAIHAFFKYLRMFEPELHSHSIRILAIPTKKTRFRVVGFLEPDELLAVFRSVSPRKPLEYRDLALLVFAYNTGARVHEIAQAVDRDIIPGKSACIRILGKGGRERLVPLWESTVQLLELYTKKYRARPRDATQSKYLFLGNRGQRLTRFQVGRIITKYMKRAALECPGMSKKLLRAHSMRHTTAVHLLESGAEPNVIKTWLGHASVESSQVYLDLDLKKKREVLELLITPDFANLLIRGKQEDRENKIASIKWLEIL